MRDRRPTSRQPFPTKVIAFGLAVMLLLTIGSATLALQTQRQVRTLTKSQVAVIVGAQRLRRLAEVSRLTVRLAASSGEQRYAAEYRKQRREMDTTYVELARAVVLPANLRAARESVRLERQLSQVEDRAIALGNSGHREQALRLLDSAAYRSLQDDYLAGLTAIRQRSTDYAAQLQSRIDSNSWITFVANLVGIPLIAVAFTLILMPARKWGGEIDQARIAAQATAEAKAEFVAVMSHELRTPLNCVRGFTDLLLQDDSLRPEQRRRLSSIDEAGSALSDVIDDVLDFSALEAGAMSLRRERFPITAPVEDTVGLVQVLADAKGLSLTTSVDPELADSYVGDPQRIRQVLLNLLGNAAKFTSEGGVELNLSLSERLPAGDRIYFEVSDSGCGIEPEMKSRLFQRFSRGSRRFGAQGGSGLGLSISKRLIELMGGAIGAKSKPGHGAVFWFEVVLRRGSEGK